VTLNEARKTIRKVLDAYQSLYWEKEEGTNRLRDMTPAEDKFTAALHMITDRHNALMGSIQKQYGDSSQRHLEALEASTIDKARDMLAAYDELMNFEMEDA